MNRSSRQEPAERTEEFDSVIRRLWNDIGGDASGISIRQADAELSYAVQRTDGRGRCIVSFRELANELHYQIKQKLKRLKSA
jgi:hypothetical protein